MSRQASDRNPASVGGRTKFAVPTAHDQPWIKPWWRPSKGKGPILFYLVAIHALALVGIILFPLPSWRVLAVAVVIAAIGGAGISVCYHRSLSHRALRLNPVVENILIFFAIFENRYRGRRLESALRRFLVGAHQMDLSVVGLGGSPLVP
jgi:hypothetical protein